MRLTRRLVINTAAFVILSALLTFILAVQVLPTVFGSTYKIYGIFSAAGGVATNQEVSYRGVQVGRVGKMSLTRDAVKIEMVINSKYKIPKDGTRARVLFKSAVGEQFVDLLPVRKDGPTFRPGDVIPESMTSIPLQIEDLLRELNTVLSSIDPKDIGTAIHELGQGLTGHGKDIKALILALDKLATTGADHQQEIADLLANGADLQDSFNASRADFEKAIDSLSTVLQTTAAHRANLTNTLVSSRELDTDLLDLLDKREKQLNQIVADLGTATRTTHMHQEDLDRLLTYLGPFLADVSQAYYAPYFVFNLVANPEPLNCTYDPSSRPVRSVTDVSKKEPELNFECAGATSTAQSLKVVALSPEAQIEADRLSWLRLYYPGD